MRRIVYSPKAYVYIQNDHGVIDLSDKVVSGNVSRKVNQVSTAEITFQNPNRMFTTPGQPTFRPMDKITIFLQRLPGVPCHTFTGYLDQTPYYQMYPGVCTIRASCTLKRLQYTYFDPGVPFFIKFLARYGWVLDGTGTLIGNSPFDANPANADDATVRASRTMSDLLYASLVHIAGLDSSKILIESLPTDIYDRIRKIYNILDDENKENDAVFDRFLKDFIGELSLGDGGSASGSVINNGITLDTLTPEQSGVFDTLMSVGDAMKVSPKFRLAAVETGLVESDLRNLNYGDASSKGWRQELTSNPRYGDGPNGATNVAASARRFYDECRQFDHGQSAGELAADVQRPASQYRGRYAERVTDAQRLIQQYDAKRSSNPLSTNTVDQSTTSQKSERDGGTPVTDNRGSTALSQMVKGVSPSGWPGPGGAYGASRSYGGHAGVDVPSTLGAIWYAAADGVVTAVSNSWTEGTGCVVIRTTQNIPNYPNNVRLGYGGTQSISVKIGDQVKAGDPIAVGGSHGSGPHLHFFMRTDDAPANGTMDPTAFAKAAQGGSTPVGGPGSSDPGSSSPSSETSLGYDDALVIAKSAGVFTAMNFPQAIDIAESELLYGNKSLMNDQPLMPFIDQLAKGTLRSYQSLPNGDFYAWHPDYFGTLGTAPYFSINDIEIMDGNINLSDDALVTHSYVVGATLPDGGIDLNRKLQTRGVVTVFNATDFLNIDPKATAEKAQNAKGKKGKDEQLEEPFLGTKAAALNFLQKYGARPAVEDAPFIRSHAFETMYAFQNFMLAWSRQFLTTFTFTFMPELYPGGLVTFEDHGIQMYVDEVTHSWDYSSGFHTQANLSAPAAVHQHSDKIGISSGLVRGGTP
jgi:murein DD-endopeptidase MepM/ murein hydrolase activator NlpD